MNLWLKEYKYWQPISIHDDMGEKATQKQSDPILGVKPGDNMLTQRINDLFQDPMLIYLYVWLGFYVVL